MRSPVSLLQIVVALVAVAAPSTVLYAQGGRGARAR